MSIYRSIIALVLAGIALPALAHHATATALPGATAVIVDEADDNRFFTRLGGVARDDISYAGLEAGQTYTIISQLKDVASGKPVGERVVATFVPKAANGVVSVQFPIAPNKTDVNIDLTPVEAIYKGDVTPTTTASPVVTLAANGTDPLRTIQVHAIQHISVTGAVDAADGDDQLPEQGGEIVATVDYANLVEGYKYTIWGQLLSKSGQGIGVYAAIPDFAPTTKSGQIEMRFKVPAGFGGISVFPAVGIYHQNRVSIRKDGILVIEEGASNPVMIASAIDGKGVKVGVPFEETR